MSWHKNTFAYRLPVEINSEHVDQDISDFVLSFKLEGDHHLFDHTRSDGYDILVTDDDGNDLPFERSVWSQIDKKLILYLRLDISSLYNTKFYIYYGDPNWTVDRQDKHSVWINYILIYHFEEQSGLVLDSSPKGRDGTVYQISGRDLDGIFGKAYRFDGVNDYVYCPDIAQFISNQWTISVSTFPKAESDHRKGIAGSGWGYHDWYVGCTSSNKFNTWVCYPSSCSYAVSNDNLVVDNYYFLTGVYNDSLLKLFINGEFNDSVTKLWSRATYYNFYVGRTHGGGEEYYNGIVDEVRVAPFAYSDARSKAEGINFKSYSDFVLIGTYEVPYLLDNAPTVFTIGKVEDDSYKLIEVDFDLVEAQDRDVDINTNLFISSVDNLISGTRNIPDEVFITDSGHMSWSDLNVLGNFFVGSVISTSLVDLSDDFTIGRVDTTVTGGVDVYNTFMVGHIVSPSGIGNDIDVEYVRPFIYYTTIDQEVDFTISTSKLFPYLTDVYSALRNKYCLNTDAEVDGGLITWYESDIYVSLSQLVRLESDCFSSYLKKYFYKSDISTISGSIYRLISDVILSTSIRKSLNTDVRLLGLEIKNFFLGEDEFTTASSSMYVDLLDYVSVVDTFRSYFVVSGTTVSSSFYPIPNGYRMVYDPLDNFYSKEPIEVLVHLENIIGDVLEQRYYLLYGYNLIYSTVSEWDWGKEIPVWVTAANEKRCRQFATDAWYFKIVEEPSTDLGASIVPLIKTKDLGAVIYPQSKAYYFGKTFEFTVFAKDKAGNAMVPFKLKFTIENK